MSTLLLFSKRPSRLRWALAWALLLALVGAAGLAAILRWHQAAAHDVASAAVADKGKRLASRLADSAAFAASVAAQASPAAADDAWREFSTALRLVQSLEGDLEYVEVRRGGITLFAQGIREWNTLNADADAATDRPVRMSRQRVGESDTEVVSFATTSSPSGASAGGQRAAPVELTLGIRRAAVDLAESPALRALDSMYRLLLWFGAAAILLAAAVLFWALRRDDRRETARRRQEHLAFSGVLANGIVHDFRNPMSSLRLDAQMLLLEAGKPAETLSLPRIADLATRMRHTLDRMEKIFQEFLALARPDAPSAHPVPLDLLPLVRESVEMLAPRAEAAHVTVSSALDAPLPAVASPSAFQRAFLNVLLNAIQHAGPDGHVLVALPPATSPRLAALEIWNTGDTIPPAAREKIFEMFYTTRPEGTGLGLFLARTALEKSAGRLSVIARAPAPPYATGFRIELPAPPHHPETSP